MKCQRCDKIFIKREKEKKIIYCPECEKIVEDNKLRGDRWHNKKLQNMFKA